LIAVSKVAANDDTQNQANTLIDKIQSLQSQIEILQATQSLNNQNTQTQNPQSLQQLNAQRLKEIQSLIKDPLHSFNDKIFTTITKEIFVSTDNEKGKPSGLRFVLWCGVEVGVEL
jgi:TolA-binding protein